MQKAIIKNTEINEKYKQKRIDPILEEIEKNIGKKFNNIPKNMFLEDYYYQEKLDGLARLINYMRNGKKFK